MTLTLQLFSLVKLRGLNPNRKLIVLHDDDDDDDDDGKNLPRNFIQEGHGQYSCHFPFFTLKQTSQQIEIQI